MSIELSRQVDKDLSAAVAGFEMEISDSVMEYLLSSIAAGLEETGKDSPDGLVLLAMDSIAGHVDVLRARSDPGAFGLIDELWQIFSEIRGGMEEQQAREMAAAELEKVLAWQRDCFVNSCSAEDASTQPAQDGGQVPGAVMAEIERHIAETREYVRSEVAALRSMAEGASQQEAFGRQLSRVVSEQVSGLESLLQEEMGRLRSELQAGAG